jgi:hypothetical protein
MKKYFLILIGFTMCGYIALNIESWSFQINKNATSSSYENNISVPPHKFSPPILLGRERAQIRAIVDLGVLTENDFRQTSVKLCNKYKYRAGGAFLVQFFSDISCLEQWDGTGLLRDSDWPYWLCRITVDTNRNGDLYARTFKIAIDENTGAERTDILKKSIK